MKSNKWNGNPAEYISEERTFKLNRIPMRIDRKSREVNKQSIDNLQQKIKTKFENG